MTVPMPDKYKDMVMYDATADAEEIASKVDFIFCAVDMKKDEIRALEGKVCEARVPGLLEQLRTPFYPGRPMIIPEINADHAEIIRHSASVWAPSAVSSRSSPTARSSPMFHLSSDHDIDHRQLTPRAFDSYSASLNALSYIRIRHA